MSDGAGTECGNCGGWIHLHYAIIDGTKMLTGKCINCGEYTDIIPEVKDTGVHVRNEDSYPGKGLYMVEVQWPGREISGCKYDCLADAKRVMWETPTVPGGFIRLTGPYTAGYDVTLKWPRKMADLENIMVGRIDALDACIGMIHFDLAHDFIREPRSFVRLAEEAEELDNPYGVGVRDIYTRVGAMFASAKVYNELDTEHVKQIVKKLEDDKKTYEEAIA